MIELYKVTPNRLEEIAVDNIVWSGQRFKAARKIVVSLLSPHVKNHKAISVEEGDTLLFKWMGKELFRGIVWGQGKSKSGMVSLTAYDILHYSLLNKMTQIFKGKRADQMFSKALKDFQVPIGSIANTGYVFKEKAFPNETTLYDIGLSTLVETSKRTGKKFRIFASQGKVNLEPVNASKNVWVIEQGKNLIDYSLNTSIDEIATRVRLEAGEEKKKIVAVIDDKEGQKKFGVIQHYEKVSGDINKAQLNARAKQVMNSKKGIKKDLSIEALGVPELYSGKPVRIKDDESPISGTYFVDTDSHTFQGNLHTMSLKIIKDNDYPEGA